jgi:DNA-directed RNA polymerase subunit RPC12/RpoP
VVRNTAGDGPTTASVDEQECRCPECQGRFFVEYRANSDPAKQLSVECPYCRAKASIILPRGILVFAVRRRDASPILPRSG